MKSQRSVATLLLAVPFLVFFCCFTVPLFWGFWMSFYNRDGVFVGLQNYINAFKNQAFRSSLSFTLINTASVVSIMSLLGLVIALGINHLTWGNGIARSVMLIPWAISLTAWGLFTKIVTSEQFGILNDILLRLGLIRHRISFLGGITSARLTVIVARIAKDLWFSALLFLVARQTITPEFYEEGKVIGASAWQCFWHITLPTMRNTILYVITIQMVFAFQEFDLVYSLARGGPGSATSTVAVGIFLHGVLFGNYEYGTALTVVWSMIVSFFVVIVFGRIMLKSEAT